MDFIEVSAKTVNDAITKACIELSASSDRLEIQVVSEGSSGFLGFGAKPAVIKVRVKEEPAEEPVVEKKPAEKPVYKREVSKKPSQRAPKAETVKSTVTKKSLRLQKK